jgi:hypothetical protein
MPRGACFPGGMPVVRVVVWLEWVGWSRVSVWMVLWKVRVVGSYVMVAFGVMICVGAWPFVVTLTLAVWSWGCCCPDGVGGAGVPGWLWRAVARGLVLPGWRGVWRGESMSMEWE